MSPIKNENGSTLLENICAVTLLLVVTAMIMSTLLGGIALYKSNHIEYDRLNGVYTDIETSAVTTNVETVEGKISFKYSDGITEQQVDIKGNYTYDKQDKKLGDFEVIE